MKCDCCRSPVDEENACCQVCGFPLLGGDGSDMSSIIGDYRRSLLGGTVLSIEQFYYGYNGDGELEELKSEYVDIANAADLPQDEILWFDCGYEPLELQREFELHALVRNSKYSFRANLLVKPDSVKTFSKLGVCTEDGCRVRFVVGDGTDNFYTESIPLLIKRNQ